jgi:hypothetical protein
VWRSVGLFVGNPREGRTTDIHASLTSTCRRHDIDPQRYITQRLINLPLVPISQLSLWLPDQWKIDHAAHLNSLQYPAPQTAQYLDFS